MLDEEILTQINAILQNKDADANKLKSFMSVYGSGPLVLEFYLKYYKDYRIMNFVCSYLDSSSFSKLLSRLYIGSDTGQEFKSYFGLRDVKDDIYLNFFNLMKDNFEIGQDIVEIGCGWIPSLARYIDNEQQVLNKGSITCYDPRLRISKSGNIILNKDVIRLDDDISNVGLMCSFNSCNAEGIFLDLAQKNNKEFILGTCKCPKTYPNDFADVMDADSSAQFKEMFSKCFECLSWSEQEIMMDVCKRELDSAYLCCEENPLDYRTYSLYLYKKLCLEEKDNAEYKLIMDDNCLSPVITKKYTKKYF